MTTTIYVIFRYDALDDSWHMYYTVSDPMISEAQILETSPRQWYKVVKITLDEALAVTGSEVL